MTAAATPLPLFDDHEVYAATVRITRAGDGLSESLRIEPRPLHIGEEVFYLLRGVVRQVNHRQKDDEGPLTRVHTVETVDITEVDPDIAAKMLTAAAEELNRRKADRAGQLPLDDLDD
jgi:hypothetical protein